jgi:hypothetical protein
VFNLAVALCTLVFCGGFVMIIMEIDPEDHVEKKEINTLFGAEGDMLDAI